jgi:hypothetical protein
MQIAYLAYKPFDAPIKEKVDALLKLNKDYPKWTAGAPDERTAKLYAFVHASTWADDITVPSPRAAPPWGSARTFSDNGPIELRRGD